jgi:UDP-N-acetylmuramoylalanine--D-glutamate ligase
MIDCRTFVEKLDQRPIAVLGMGVSGLATVAALVEAGAAVVAWDDNETGRVRAAEEGAHVVDFSALVMDQFAALVLAPGIPFTHNPHPVVQMAKTAGIPIIGDFEILHECEHDRRTFGITGTNGKSTTTALIAHILQSAGIDTAVGGNLGTAALALDMPEQEGAIVLEVSSYQMDLSPTWRPDIAVLLNITPDHLDRHGEMDDYAAAKAHIFEGEGVGICGVDDEYSLSIYEKAVAVGTRTMIPVSVNREIPNGVYAKNNNLIDHTTGVAIEIADLSVMPTLKGLHNQQNMCAAYVACRGFGLSVDVIIEAMKTYPGLPHRQFTVRTINGVLYVNDSKATNAEASSKAIASFQNIYLIAGGQPKAGGLEGLQPLLDRIRHVYLIGEAAEDFSHWCDKNGVPNTICGTIDVAVIDAHAAAQRDRGEPGGAGTVLLSPACASWDQFENYGHRGDVFTEIVNNLSVEIPE